LKTDFSYTERKLLTAIAAGDETAFGEIFHAWRDKLYYYLLRITQSAETAEDQVQDIFIKIWVHRHKLAAVDDFGAWLFTVARNHALSGMRRMALETVMIGEMRREAVAAGRPVDEALLFKQIREKLKSIVDALPAQQKLVYQLGREQGIKHEEIARQLNISMSTVRNHMALALQTIRAKLLEYYPAASVGLVLGLFTFGRN
jgi:RNA polymerase sigma-70 factor (ECF subfamily)